ncbi:TonB-dependent vitamin B12 receptor [Cognatilysobacter tabacisoli]|uniref:TonB-dependent vitamin B12 receptor n=1 Tax=Cognatilysobacter tabacisoli TaxID=2315424 RepID=UPI0018C87B3A
MTSRFVSNRRRVLAVALSSAFAATASPLLAQDAATDLDSVVVTAARTAQTQDATLAAVTVITRAQIEALQPASLPELLRGTPGAAIANNGGAGKESSLFLRGTESDHTLVLVDGIKVGSATAGKAALQDIPVEQIERIEIVRGPFSSLYGSEAIGGVVQIFTRKPRGAFNPNFSFGVGSFDTVKLSAGLSGRGERGWYAVNAAHEETDGIDACRGFGFPVFAGCFTDEPDLDGYRNRSLSLSGGVTLAQDWDLEARALRGEGRNEYDGGFANESDTVQQVASTRLRWRASDALTLTATAGRSDDQSDDFKDRVATGYFETRRDQGSLQADLRAGGALLTAGFDWLRDAVDSSEPYDIGQRINRGAFAQWQQAFGAHSLQASVRRDEDNQFGGQTTGSALWGWNASDALRVTASAGTAYKAPSFNELYYPFFGNPDLVPETSRSVELGVRGSHGWGGWTLNAFDTRIDDLIAYDSTPAPGRPFGRPNNIERARIRGVEATASTTLAGWTLAGHATWLDPRNDSGVNRDRLLPRRARVGGRVDVDRRFGAVSVGASVTGSGDRFDNPGNNVRLGGYATTDLRVGYALSPAWRLQLSANNVFDRDYETAAYYRQPGRNYLVTLRYSAVE